MTLDEQLEVFDATVDLAYERCLQLMVEHREEIIANARRRMIEVHPVMGDKSWHRDPVAVFCEVMQELEDAPAWMVICMHREAVCVR